MRRTRRVARGLMVFASGLVSLIPISATASTNSSTPLSIRVVGAHLVNSADQTVRLVGVGGLGTEYACVQGWGYTSTPLDAATVRTLASWHVNVARVTLNEDCWLGINGAPSYGTRTGYREAVESFVTALNHAGIYAIIDLHWSAPGSESAVDQMAMPDSHSLAFWSSVATIFKTNHAVLFDLFNEPFSPSQIWSGAPVVTWNCWRLGGCPVPVTNQSQRWTTTTPTYKAVGMQQLVDVVRATGANQPLMLGGLSYANDLSGFLDHEPTDPLRPAQLVASFHNYSGQSCQFVSCWNDVIAPLAKKVPVVTGEFGEGNYCSYPPALPASRTSFDRSYMQWADEHDVSYLAWGWFVNGTPPPCGSSAAGSSSYGLISSDAGAPVAPDGQLLKSHLAVLYASNRLL
jgi:endoglucanase